MTFALPIRFRRRRRGPAAPELPAGPGAQNRDLPLGSLQPIHLLLLR